MWPFKNQKKRDELTQQVTDFLEEARKMKDDIESTPDGPPFQIPQISFVQAEALALEIVRFKMKNSLEGELFNSEDVLNLMRTALVVAGDQLLLIDMDRCMKEGSAASSEHLQETIERCRLDIQTELQRAYGRFSISEDKLGRRVAICLAKGNTEDETVEALGQDDPDKVREAYRLIKDEIAIETKTVAPVEGTPS